jgi:hypothetical protein
MLDAWEKGGDEQKKKESILPNPWIEEEKEEEILVIPIAMVRDAVNLSRIRVMVNF